MACDTFSDIVQWRRVMWSVFLPLLLLSAGVPGRSAQSGPRVDWKAPYGMACDTFSNYVQLAPGGVERVPAIPTPLR